MIPSPRTLFRASSVLETAAKRPKPPTAAEYRYFLAYNTRWSDNDMCVLSLLSARLKAPSLLILSLKHRYGHVNNVQYLHYVDSIGPSPPPLPGAP